jgi:3-phenylpropionate/trans-cinnamate dioxygenase ferredoxin component
VSQLVKVAAVSELPPGAMRAVEANGRRVLLVNLEGEVHVLDAHCPHRGGPLDEGELWNGAIECPWHHYRYDVRTGENVYPKNIYPADLASLKRDLRPVRRYPVQIAGDQIWVAI